MEAEEEEGACLHDILRQFTSWASDGYIHTYVSDGLRDLVQRRSFPSYSCPGMGEKDLCQVCDGANANSDDGDHPYYVGYPDLLACLGMWWC